MADDVRRKSLPRIANGLHGPQLPHAPAPSLVNVSMPRRGYCSDRRRHQLAKVNCLFDHVIQCRVLRRQRHTQFQFGALDLAFANDALNLALRGDADDFEEPATAMLKLSSSILASRKPIIQIIIADPTRASSLLNDVD